MEQETPEILPSCHCQSEDWFTPFTDYPDISAHWCTPDNKWVWFQGGMTYQTPEEAVNGARTVPRG